MRDLLRCFLESLNPYLELLPIALVGLLAGFMSALDNSENIAKCFKIALKRIVLSSFLCVVAYSILSATDLPYLARVGISACIGFLGIEKAISYAKEILNFKRGGK